MLGCRVQGFRTLGFSGLGSIRVWVRVEGLGVRVQGFESPTP